MNKKISYRAVSSVFSILVLCFVVGFYVVAWTPPTASPPGDNLEAPINVSDSPQYKTGSLRLGGLTVDSETYLATNSGKVGIGTTNPGAKLDVNGQIIIRGGSPAPGKVLTSVDSSGLIEWRTPSSGSFSGAPGCPFEGILDNQKAYGYVMGFNDEGGGNDFDVCCRGKKMIYFGYGGRSHTGHKCDEYGNLDNNAVGMDNCIEAGISVGYSQTITSDPYCPSGNLCNFSAGYICPPANQLGSCQKDTVVYTCLADGTIDKTISTSPVSGCICCSVSCQRLPSHIP